MLNGPARVAHLSAMGQWAKDGKFIYTGRRNEVVLTLNGECALFTESLLAMPVLALRPSSIRPSLIGKL